MCSDCGGIGAIDSLALQWRRWRRPAPALKKTFRQHFQAHPLSEIERQLKRPGRRLAIPPSSRLETRRPSDFIVTDPLLPAPSADDFDDVLDHPDL